MIIVDKSYLVKQFENLEGYSLEYHELEVGKLDVLTSVYAVFNLIPTASDDYVEVSSPSGSIFYVGSDIDATPDVTVPDDATKVEIQAISDDMRICISENTTASSTNGQLYAAGSPPRTILLNSKHRITVYSLGNVGIQWGY